MGGWGVLEELLFDGVLRAVEAGLAAVTGRMLALLPAQRVAALTDGPVTIDLDTTDVEVYGRKKRARPRDANANWYIHKAGGGTKPRRAG